VRALPKLRQLDAAATIEDLASVFGRWRGTPGMSK
jgi:antitoxin HigA-1